jgi:glutaredoxin
MDDASLPEGGLKAAYPRGLNVVVARVDGAVYALSGACLHVGCPLFTGSLSAAVFTCRWCRKTKVFFKEHGVPFDFVDDDLADEATQKRIMKELDANGANGFPFVRIGDAVTIGYNPGRYKELLGL